MTAMGAAIKRLREERNWTQAELGEKVGLDGTNIARRESGRTRVHPSERPLFAKAFGMTLIQFDEAWRDWSVPRSVGGEGVPIINQAPAGKIIDYEEYGIDSGQGYTYVDRGAVDDAMAFGVIVVGDSMEPRLREGDCLILSPADPYKRSDQLVDGKIVLVRFTTEHGGGCTVARYFREGDDQVRLQKDNPRYKPIVCNRAAIQSIAVGVERREKL